MDFELSPAQQALQREARQFAQREFTPEYVRECELAHRYPGEARRRACQAGLIGVHLPEEFGGRGLGLLESVLVIEALCSQDPGLGMAISLSSLGSQMFAGLGTESQKSRILAGLTSGEILTTVAFTEPDHGSDLTDLDTVAVRDGDEWVVNGAKTFISNGLEAALMAVLCKTDPAASPAYRGMSLILVETDRPGFTATDLGQKMGLRTMSTCELAFKDVRVPVANTLGREGRGFYHTMEFLDQTRVEVAAQALGGAQAAFDRALAHLRSRARSGSPLSRHQVNRHKLADMATKLELSRLLTYRAAWAHDSGHPDSMLASMAKLTAARFAVEVAEEAVQLLGGRGYFFDGEVERIYRDVRVTEIYEGTREIQKNTIAAALVGRTGGN